MSTADAILDFWFRDNADKWFGGGPAFDAEVTQRFGDDLAAAIRGDCDAWGAHARGRLALIILLDQFSRQIYRGQARAFAQDGKALALTKEGIRLGQDQELSGKERGFFYMPLMHAEDIRTQDEAVRLFGAIDPNMLMFAEKHRDTIKRFGRFPRRNAALERTSTADEHAYMDAGGQF